MRYVGRTAYVKKSVEKQKARDTHEEAAKDGERLA